MPFDPMLLAPTVTVEAQVTYWPDRIRLAWAVLTGRMFQVVGYDVKLSVSTQEAANGIGKLDAAIDAAMQEPPHAE